jgi:hypothetical protein
MDKLQRTLKKGWKVINESASLLNETMESSRFSEYDENIMTRVFTTLMEYYNLTDRNTPVMDKYEEFIQGSDTIFDTLEKDLNVTIPEMMRKDIIAGFQGVALKYTNPFDLLEMYVGVDIAVIANVLGRENRSRGRSVRLDPQVRGKLDETISQWRQELRERMIERGFDYNVVKHRVEEYMNIIYDEMVKKIIQHSRSEPMSEQGFAIG